MLSRAATALLLACVLAAQPRPPAGAGELRRSLERLRTLGSVLMIAAHPDDENTALLAWFARGRNLRTAYLSMTRGEGGQNLIGSEQGELMGLIRTQELLMARRIDGAEQFFSRAIDFGFTKTVDETLAKWGREQALSDVVLVIRRFQPDVIVLRFSGTPRDGHGQHQSSALLGREAFDAAADPARFPEQLREVKPWRAKRILYNFPTFTPEMRKEAAAAPDKIEIDAGEFDPLSGYSFGEIEGLSRSLHRSQAMGWREHRGSLLNYLRVIGGDPAKGDPLEGIDASWTRVDGGAAIDAALRKAESAFDPRNPAAVIPALVDARREMARSSDVWAKRKLAELDDTLALAAGLWLDASTTRAAASPGGAIDATATAVSRARGAQVKLLGVDWSGAASGAVAGDPATLTYNTPVTRSAKIPIRADQPYSQPFWLEQPVNGATYSIRDQSRIGPAEGAPVIEARFRLDIGGAEITLARPLVNRYVDPARGELTRPVVIAPPVSVEFSERTLVFATRNPRETAVQVRANQAGAEGEVRIEAPAGWTVAPASRPFKLAADGEIAVVRFTVTPPAADSTARLLASAKVGGRDVRHGMRVIAYDHIPPQTVFPEAAAKVVRVDARVLSKRAGYVMGAGDDVPQALEQLGLEVTLLGPSDLASGDLSKFDVIVTGVRAYNTRADLRANQQRLLDFVARGGTMIVQYNVAPNRFFGARDADQLARIGPYPVKMGAGRVTVEEAAMQPTKLDHPLLQAPNTIRSSDYDGWIQERGLYFAETWDSKYEPLWEIADPGEKPQQGGTLAARHGQGVYILTPLAWFRQLPAGVPGAYRIFANFLSAGKVTK